MKEVFVGKNRTYKNISTALFIEGNKDVIYYIDEGEYDDYITLENASNLTIIGNGEVKLMINEPKSQLVLIDNSNKINISNLFVKGNGEQIGFYINGGLDVIISNNIIENCVIGLKIYDSRKAFFKNNLIVNNKRGCYLELPNDSLFKSNSFVRNLNVGLQIEYLNKLAFEKNIFSDSQAGIFISSKLNGFELYSNQNICFNNNKNYQGFDIKDILEKKLDFEDPEKNDFRPKDTLFKEFGTSEEILLRYAGKSKSDEEGEFTLNRRIAFFANYSITALKSEFSDFITQSELTNYLEINSSEDLKNADYEVMAFINGIDTHDDKDLIFTLLAQVKANQKPFYIFLPSKQYTTSLDKINLENSAYVQQTKKKIIKNYAENVLEYNDFNDLKQQLLEKIQVHNPKVIFRKLKLNNIGHFKELNLSFDARITCLIGLNGTGKTTILRALALGLIGYPHRPLNNMYVKKMLRIEGIKDGLIRRDSGFIEVNFGIDGNKYENKINFSIESDNEVIIADAVNATIYRNSDFLQSLIIGFAQSRGVKNGNNELKQRNKVQIPHISDLIPLINNVEDNRLQIFSKWIVDLVAEAEKEENRILKEKGSLDGLIVRERVIIQKVFEILSAITEEKIELKEVFQNEDVWVTTLQSPEGISIELLSQGYQSVMGWIGYFIQRMAEAYPNSKDFTKEPAICLVDEIDTYLHPKWQSKIVEQLLAFFTNTQFIISTHSPLILSFLNQDQIRILKVEGNEIIAYKPSTKPFGADTNRILSLIMDTEERANTEIREKLKNYILLIENDEFEKAEELKKELIKLIDPEDPELIKGNILIKTKNLLFSK